MASSNPWRSHPTAEIEGGVTIGAGTAIWDNVHVRGPGTQIGADCIIGEKTYIAPAVLIGDRVKINAQVYVCTGVTIGTGVMLSAGVTFTNDRFPRACTPDLAELRPSEADEHTVATAVGDGATVGARAVIGPGADIGRFAMVGMGSVVTRPVPDFALVVGNPARLAGWVCRCGEPWWRAGEPPVAEGEARSCSACGRSYRMAEGVATEASAT